MSAFNPDTPCVIGAQWFPPFEPSPLLDGVRAGICAVVESQVTEADPELWVNFAQVNGSPTIALDVYPYGSYDIAETTTGTHRPTQDVLNVDAWAWGSFSPGGTQTNIYRAIDAASLTPGTWPNTAAPVTNNEFIFPIFGSGYECSFRFGGIAGLYTGRICKVALKAKINIFVDGDLVKGMKAVPYLNIGGQRYYGPSASPSDTARLGHALNASWDFNPATGGPWTIADIDEFDAVGGSYSAGWIVSATGSSNNLATILQGWMEITESTPDNRVGSGIFRDAAGQLDNVERGWNKVLWTVPWDKVADDIYVLHFYRSSGSGGAALRMLSARDSEPGDHNGHVVATPIYYTRSDRLAGIEEDSPGSAIAMILTDGAGVPTVDSQPYVSVNGDINLDCGVDENWPRYGDFAQLFTPTDSADYGFVRVMIRTTNGAPVGDVTIGIYRESDDALMSSEETVTLADLIEPTFGAQGWQVVEVEFATPASLTAATQYYVGIVADDDGWEVQVLSCGLIDLAPSCGPPVGAEDTKWGGTADPLRISGTDFQQLTAALTVHQMGPALDSFLLETEIADPDTNACGLELGDCVQFARLTYSVPTEGDCAFDYVEVSRLDGARWNVIAKDYTFSGFDDYESPRNVDVYYRARLRMVGGGIGETSEDSTIVAAPCVGLILASNLLPSLAAYYSDVGGTRDYEFVENVTEIEFENDYAVEIFELANRGDRFTAELLIGATVAGCAPGVTPGRDAFNALLESVRPNLGATVPYIAVMDETGARWFAAIRTPSGRIANKAVLTAPIIVREVTDTPYIVTVLPEGGGSGS